MRLDTSRIVVYEIILGIRDLVREGTLYSPGTLAFGIEVWL